MKNLQAFPVQQFTYDGKMNILQYQDDGMTLLDYFAAKAMQGLVVNQGNNNYHIRQPNLIAEDCYNLAKAMLLEREKVMKEMES